MAEQILTARRLTKKYGHTAAVSEVNMSIEKGQIYGLVGRNGAGKTSIIRMITAQSTPTQGEIQLFGSSSTKELSNARSRTGAMVEMPSFYPYLSARENLEYYRKQRGIPGKNVVEEALKQVNLTNTGKKTFKQFSLGMKQRLGLALALMNHPEFLLLDEPINGLDPEGIVEFRNILLRLNRDRAVTILISSHILSELSNVATEYGFLDHGVMLEQVSASALQEKCRACIQLRVDDAPKAAGILELQLGCRDFEVLPNQTIRLYQFMDEPQKVNAAIVNGGVALYASETKSVNLEDYFLSLIGGGIHA
jgi:ABC-2 type transport system ATP-binding protein